MCGGDVHIIPQPSSPAEIMHYPVGTPTLPQAISLVRSDTPTVASKPIQEAIQRKIKLEEITIVGIFSMVPVAIGNSHPHILPIATYH